MRLPLSIALILALLAYAAASFLHHAHNAEFLGEYPNMPGWITPAAVYAAWLAATAVGVVGYFLFRGKYRIAGLGLLIAYGCYGLDALVHYALAPASAHSVMMNLSIWLEAVTAMALLIVVLRRRNLQ